MGRDSSPVLPPLLAHSAGGLASRKPASSASVTPRLNLLPDRGREDLVHEVDR